MNTIQQLTYKQTVELLRRLNGGAAGFDYGKYKLADLRNIILAWLGQGCFTAETLTAHVAAIVAESAPMSQPTIPAFGGAQAQQPAQPVPAAQSIPTFGAAPAPVTVHAPLASVHSMHVAVAQETLPENFAAPVVAQVAPEPVAQPVAAAKPVAVEPAPVVLLAGTAHRVTARSLFEDQPAVAAALPEHLTVNVYADPDAPAIDRVYQFDPAQVALAIIALSCAPTLRCWLGGPRGSGKTEFARQIAARLGRQFFRVNFNRATEAAEFIGDIGLVKGATQWVDGPVASALRTPGAILLLDELTYAAQGNIAALNPLLEPNATRVRLPRTGEVLEIQPDVFICAADNTFGYGDTTGEYQARGTMGADTLNRFAFFLSFDYLPAATESKVLRQMVERTCGRKMTKSIADVIVKIMAVARERSNVGELMGAPSLRSASAFATALALGVDPATAYNVAIVRAAPVDSHEALRQVFAAHWPADIPADASASAAAFSN